MKFFLLIISMLSWQALADFDFPSGSDSTPFPNSDLAIKYYEESHDLEKVDQIGKFAAASGLLLGLLLRLNTCQLYKYKFDGTEDDKLPAAPGPMVFGFKAKDNKIVEMSEYLNLDSLFKIKFYWKYIARKFACSNVKGTVCEHEKMKYELKFFNEHAFDNAIRLLIVNTPKVKELSYMKNTFYICH
ncbi:MAG: hypothetical protein HYV97_18485 [Bdellovibrio sp.]|nr:hypothetical protein [Bdellovibrio sp.]